MTEPTNYASQIQAPMPTGGSPPDLVAITLVPVEVFGGDCDCHEQSGHSDLHEELPPDMTVLRSSSPAGVIQAVKRCHGWGYGLCDAVPSWSDCNRASGRIYRVEDSSHGLRTPGTVLTVWVARDQLPWFEHRWGEEYDDGDRSVDGGSWY